MATHLYLYDLQTSSHINALLKENQDPHNGTNRETRGGGGGDEQEKGG